MSDHAAQTDASTPTRSPGLAWSLVRLGRPAQWSKSAFVLVGPVYGLAALPEGLARAAIPALAAATAFGLVSSASYAINDLLDAEADRQHPRKRKRPIASGAVSPAQAVGFAVVLLALAGATLALVPMPARLGLGATLAAYIVNVGLYSTFLKHSRIADVIGLSLGFVLRVLGGCLAVGLWPSSWLLNCTLFLAMFLSFGKRLGERRTMGDADRAAAVRAVHGKYTDELLRMAVVVTGVATLLTYAAYVQAQHAAYSWAPEWATHPVSEAAAQAGEITGFNLLWLTLLPATFGLLRCIVLLEQGVYDDPTELALRDRPFALAAAVFALLTVLLVGLFRLTPAASDPGQTPAVSASWPAGGERAVTDNHLRRVHLGSAESSDRCGSFARTRVPTLPTVGGVG